MNSDPNKTAREQMEVRIVALLLGESSPFETAEIQAAMQRDPELAAFHDEMRRTIDVVGQASKISAQAPAQEEPKLSPDRREALLSQFKEKKVIKFPYLEPIRKYRRWLLPVSLAAGFLLFAGMLGSLMLPALARSKAKAQRISTAANLRQLGLAYHEFADKDAVQVETGGPDIAGISGDKLPKGGTASAAKIGGPTPPTVISGVEGKGPMDSSSLGIPAPSVAYDAIQPTPAQQIFLPGTESEGRDRTQAGERYNGRLGEESARVAVTKPASRGSEAVVEENLFAARQNDPASAAEGGVYSVNIVGYANTPAGEVIPGEVPVAAAPKPTVTLTAPIAPPVIGGRISDGVVNCGDGVGGRGRTDLGFRFGGGGYGGGAGYADNNRGDTGFSAGYGVDSFAREQNQLAAQKPAPAKKADGTLGLDSNGRNGSITAEQIKEGRRYLVGGNMQIATAAGSTPKDVQLTQNENLFYDAGKIVDAEKKLAQGSQQNTENKMDWYEDGASKTPDGHGQHAVGTIARAKPSKPPVLGDTPSLGTKFYSMGSFTAGNAQVREPALAPRQTLPAITASPAYHLNVELKNEATAVVAPQVPPPVMTPPVAPATPPPGIASGPRSSFADTVQKKATVPPQGAAASTESEVVLQRAEKVMAQQDWGELKTSEEVKTGEVSSSITPNRERQKRAGLAVATAPELALNDPVVTTRSSRDTRKKVEDVSILDDDVDEKKLANGMQDKLSQQMGNIGLGDGSKQQVSANGLVRFSYNDNMQDNGRFIVTNSSPQSGSVSQKPQAVLHGTAGKLGSIDGSVRHGLPPELAQLSDSMDSVHMLDMGSNSAASPQVTLSFTNIRSQGEIKLNEPPAAAKLKQAVEDRPVTRAPVPVPTPQPEITTRENAFSTFSLNVSDVSFKLAASSLQNGVMPEPGSIRVEEFVNAFNYRDPAPKAGARLAFAWERAAWPFGHNRDVLRFSVQTAARGRESAKPLNIVLLMDCSGSMERPDRVAIMSEALKVLAQKLQPQDKISVVAFARTARLWVDGMAGGKPQEFLDKVLGLNPEGGTNLEEAMFLAYETALRHYLPQGVNRVILLTDGAANLGNIDPEMLKQKVVAHRAKGIALDCFGIGWEGYNDDLLETLSRNGDGRYGFLDHPQDAAPEFAEKLAGALSVAASDVKAQVEFNPARVQNWRQIGYAKHQLTKEQFRDNTVDAAEIAAAESGNALYIIQVNSQGTGPLGTVRVRYKVPETGQYVEQEWELPYEAKSVAMDKASPSMRLASTAAAFGEWLSRSPYAAEVNLPVLQSLISDLSRAYDPDPRPANLSLMLQQAQRLSGK